MIYNNEKIITQDNNYIIELYKHLSIFNHITLCTISFKSILNNPIISISIPNYEILNLADNLYAFYELGDSIDYIFNSLDNNLISYGFNLHVEKPTKENGYLTTRDIFTLYSICNNTKTIILNFEITNMIEEFCDKLYSIFIEDNIIDEIKL